MHAVMPRLQRGSTGSGPVLLVLVVIGVTLAGLATGGGPWTVWVNWPWWGQVASAVAALLVFVLLSDPVFGLLFFATLALALWGPAHFSVGAG